MTHTYRDRLVNAVVFFAENVRHCGKIKLFKLLYLLDFEHFRQTGKSVTGFEYQAWKFGPVPIELMEEWDEFGEDLAQAVQIEPEKVIDYVRETIKVKPGVSFDSENFTSRQLSIMRSLALKYADTYSPALIDVTHLQNGAWDKVWQDGLGAREKIPYALALSEDAPHRDEILAIEAENAMYQAALQAARNATAA